MSVKDGGTPLDSDGLTLIRSLVGGVAYAAAGSRPDLLVPCNQLSLCQSLEFATVEAVNYGRAILRYILGTRGALFRQKITKLSPDAAIIMDLFSDANFGPSFARSGLVSLLNDNVCFWKSARQRNICLSTTEAECCALSSCARYAVGLKIFLVGLGYKIDGRIKLAVDNQSTAFLARSCADLRKVRHLSLANLYVREVVDEGLVHIEWIPDSRMQADGLTKCLPFSVWQRKCPWFIAAEPRLSFDPAVMLKYDLTSSPSKYPKNDK